MRITAPAPDHAQLGGVGVTDHHDHAATGIPAHGNLSGVTSDQHHTTAHTPESHTGQGATAAELETLTDASAGVTLHTHVVNPAIAGQGNLEAETPGEGYARPQEIRFSPGVSKGWCRITAAGALESPSFNVASVTDTGLGDRLIVWDDDFSTAVYIVTLSVDAPIIATHCNQNEVIGFAVGQVQIIHYTNTTFVTPTDMQGSFTAYGDQ